MALGRFEAAKKILSRSGWSLSNLELQKLMYIAQLRFKRLHPGDKLILTDFEAWDYGPVAPEIYHRAKVFGSEPVQNIFHSVGTPASPLDHHLYEAMDLYADASPARLVQLTHQRGGAWATYYQPGAFGVKIPDRAIDQEAASYPTP